MKRLVFLLLFVGFFSKAESICDVYVEISSYDADVYIRENCKKNDILSVRSIADNLIAQRMMLLAVVETHCRFDREIIFKLFGETYFLVCVLNSTEPRPDR